MVVRRSTASLVHARVLIQQALPTIGHGRNRRWVIQHKQGALIIRAAKERGKALFCLPILVHTKSVDMIAPSLL